MGAIYDILLIKDILDYVVPAVQEKAEIDGSDWKEVLKDIFLDITEDLQKEIAQSLATKQGKEHTQENNDSIAKTE